MLMTALTNRLQNTRDIDDQCSILQIQVVHITFKSTELNDIEGSTSKDLVEKHMSF